MEALIPLILLIALIAICLLSFKPLMRASLKEERLWQEREASGSREPKK